MSKRVCISCKDTKNVRYQGPRCVNCYRKEINPQAIENIKIYCKRIGATQTDRFHKGKTEAKIRKITWALTKDEFSKLNIKPCFYCGGPLPKNGVGLDRISNDKKIGYCKENVLPCCGPCNSIRGDKLTVSETMAAMHAVRESRNSVIYNFHQNHYHLDSRSICIFGPIDEEMSIKVQQALDVLEAVNSYAEITIKIMSEGGNWFDGLAIYDRINLSPCPIKMIGTGMVASTATAIFQAGDVREITNNCLFVLHDGTEGFEGEAKSFEAWAETSKKSRQLLYDIYSKASGKPPSFWQTLCLKDSILWKEDILAFGLADKVTE